jgi:AcrR family transcriptional regulator
MNTVAKRAHQREHRETTRAAILTATNEFLRTRPYRELSVESVMSGTGLTRTAFYRHFDDVPDLVLRLLADVLEDLYEVGAEWSQAAGEGYPTPALAGLGRIVAFFAKHGPMLQAIADAAATDEKIEAGFTGLRRIFNDLTSATLDRLQARGQLEVPDTRSMARALNLMNEAYLLDEFGRKPFGRPELVLATLETVWLRVLGSPDPAQPSA